MLLPYADVPLPVYVPSPSTISSPGDALSTTVCRLTPGCTVVTVSRRVTRDAEAFAEQSPTHGAIGCAEAAPTSASSSHARDRVASVRGALELHIVHSESTAVPVLLLQGQQPDGSPWTPDELRAHLRRRDGADGGVATLSGNVVTQLEHPVLCVPSCCVDPCGDGDADEELLSGAPEGDGRQLDYLSAWWSVLAPLVGAESRSAWYALSTPP